MNENRPAKQSRTALIFLALFAVGIAAGYVFFLKASPEDRGMKSALKPEAGKEMIKLYFPSDGRLRAEERQVQKAFSRLAAARTVVEEFLKGPAGNAKSYVPEGAGLIDIYDGADGILYVDLSDAFRNGFEADAMSEFLLLRGLYESIIANVYGVVDVKVLIAGAEVETLGGHISIARPLGETVTQAVAEE